MRRLFALLLLGSCASASSGGSTRAPAVIRPSDDAATVIRALERVDGALGGTETGLGGLEEKLDKRTSKEPAKP